MGDSTDTTTSVSVTVAGGVVTMVNNSPATGPVDITLGLANVTGTVYESNATPAANAQVSAGAPGLLPEHQHRSNGTYAFALGNGTWNVTANPPAGDSTDAPTSVSVTVAGGVVTMVNGSPATGPVDITLHVATVSGTVNESPAAGGSPAGGAGINAVEQGQPSTANTGTDSQGHYALTLGNGTWTITVTPPMSDTTDAPVSNTVVVSGGAVISVDGVPHSGPVNFTLVAGGSISGTVSDTSTPPVGLGGICVAAFPVDNPDGLGGLVTTAANGTYTMSKLAPGSYDVEFIVLGGCPGGGVGNYATEWYQDAASQSSATAVTVGSGMTTGSIDATMVPSPPPPPPGSTGSASGTSTSSSGTATATNDGTTVAASGQGSFTVSAYGGNPVSTPPGFSTPGGFSDVAVAPGSDFTSITVSDCNLNGANTLQYWTGSVWVTVSPTTGPTGTPPCLTATISATSTPTLSELTGTVFAAVIVPVATSTTIARPGGASVTGYGSSLTFTATVKVPSGLATPNGTVTFYDGSTAISGPVSLSVGVAKFTTTSLGVGRHSITADYSGDAYTLPSSSMTLSQTVVKRVSATSLSPSVDPSTVGQGVTFTATLSPHDATGTVTFYDGSKAIAGPVNLSAGVAGFTTSSLIVGVHVITADYSGDANTLGSISWPVVEVVAKRSSATALSSSANPSKSGHSVKFTATVTPPTATGSITFMDAHRVLGTCTLSGGACSLSTTGLSRGTHPITAVYGGDGQTAGSTSVVLQQVIS